MLTLTQGTFRPSNLPRIGECVWYRPQDEPTEEARRGERIDTIYRALLTRDRDNVEELLSNAEPGDVLPASWAANTTERLAQSCEVIANKAECQIQIPEFPRLGEIDAYCRDQFCSFDLKTGQWYNYKLQAAAYARGLMEWFFINRWTVEILFCDLRYVECHQFEYEETRQLILDLKRRFDAAGAPVCNHYCAWCANAGVCPALINRADRALALVEKPNFDFEGLLANPTRLGRFLAACHAIKPLEQEARDRAEQYLLQKTEVPGWSLIRRAPGKYVEPAALLPVIEKLGPGPVLEQFGSLSFPRYERLCADAQLQPDPGAAKPGAGTVYLRQHSTKEKYK